MRSRRACCVSSACAVFIGLGDLGAWERLEMAVALNRAATDTSFRLFPVLLPGLEPFEPGRAFHRCSRRVPGWTCGTGLTAGHVLQRLVNAVYGVPFGPRRLRSFRRDGPPPYRGLEAFEEEDARFFFGREAEMQRLLEKLRGDRLLAVVGQSGGGKSSLVRAGLLPQLRSEGLADRRAAAGLEPASCAWRPIAGARRRIRGCRRRSTASPPTSGPGT